MSRLLQEKMIYTTLLSPYLSIFILVLVMLQDIIVLDDRFFHLENISYHMLKLYWADYVKQTSFFAFPTFCVMIYAVFTSFFNISSLKKGGKGE